MSEKHRRPEASVQFLKEEYGIETTVGTLAKARCTGGDTPPFRKVGRAIYYAESDLRAWAEKVLGPSFRNTSDLPG